MLRSLHENTTRSLERAYGLLSRRIRPTYLRRLIASLVWFAVTIMAAMFFVDQVYSALGWCAVTIAVALAMGYVEKWSDNRYRRQRKQVKDIASQLEKLKLRLA